jgi:hypothetical protein
LKKTPLKRTAGLKRSGSINPRNKDRRAREFARAYGCEDRVLFVKHGLRCVAPYCYRTTCDNAHIEGGGMGRKAHYTKIVPLCSGLAGHHAQFHELGSKAAFEARHRERDRDFDLDVEAEWTETMWQTCGPEFVEHHRRLAAIETIGPDTEV